VSDLVDWGLARRIAGIGIDDRPGEMPGGVDLASSGTRSAAAVLDYTGLSIGEPLPEAEWVTRAEWADVNLRSMSELLEPVGARIGDFSGPGGGSLAPITRRVLAVEIGALIGFASRHVLGQYEFPLLGADRSPRLLFLGENLGNATGQLGGRADQVLDWVALHEVTHAVHFASAPWLRGHIGDLARTLLAESPARIPVGEVLARARGFSSADPRRTLAELRASDPISLLAPAESLAAINAIQAAMASIEGYAEHVMDAAAGDLGPAVGTLRAGIERRRENRSPIARLLSWLFGFELKLRQYRDGKRFCDAVVDAAGIEALNRAWAGPAALPELAELGAPSAWIERVAAAPSAA
jgi:coenzyme F420 biosynthesis associated uncharacterized protein